MNKSALKGLNLFLVASALLCSATVGNAEIYKYTDYDGHIYLTDQPMKGPYRLISVTRLGQRPSRSASPSYDVRQFRANKVRFSPIIDKVASRYQLHPELLHAVIRAESAYDPRAVSSAGAVGLMQLMPGTAKRYGVLNRRDPVANLDGGARYLRDLLQLFGDDMKLALAAYNAGENAVVEHGNRIPPYAETRRYVDKVLKFYRQNRQAKAY